MVWFWLGYTLQTTSIPIKGFDSFMREFPFEKMNSIEDRVMVRIASLPILYTKGHKGERRGLRYYVS